MTDHERTLQLSAAAIDFALTPAEHAMMTAHLAGCADCRSTVARFRADAASLAAVRDPAAPDRVRERVLGAALEAPAPSLFSRPLLAAAAALLVVVLAGATFAVGAQVVQWLRPSPLPVPVITPTPSGSAGASWSPQPTAGLTPAPSPALTWRAVEVPVIASPASVQGVTVRADGTPLYVAVGVSDWGSAASSAGGNYHLGTSWISEDGTTWRQGGAIPTARMVWDVAYGAGQFVAVGDWSGEPATGEIILAAYAGGEPPGVWHSSDGQHWSGMSLGHGLGIGLVVFGDEGFVAVGGDTRCTSDCPPASELQTPIFTSADGVTWETHVFSDGRINGLAALSGGGYLAVGHITNTACPGGPDGTSTVAWYSADGVTWMRVLDEGTCGSLSTVDSGDSGYMAAGTVLAPDGSSSHAVAWLSGDGRTWGAPLSLVALEDSSFTLDSVGRTWVVATQSAIWELTESGSLIRSSDAAVPSDSALLGLTCAGAVCLGSGSSDVVALVSEPRG